LRLRAGAGEFVVAIHKKGRQTMKKRVLVLVPLLVILLSGCITVRVETKIKQDGGGTKSFVLALDKSVVSVFESMVQESGASVDDLWAEARAGAASIKGAKVEDYSDDETEGIKLTIPFKNLDELQALSSSDAFRGTDTVTVSKDGDTMTLKAVVNVGDFASELGEAGGQELEGFDLGEIEFEYTYAIDVEGKILAYSPKNIAEVKGSKVTWDLTQADTETIELIVRWEPGGGPNMIVILAAVILGLAVLLVGAGIVMMMRSKRPSDQLNTS
jgi:hypothetical protein